MCDDQISNLKARQSKHEELNYQQNEKVGRIESADGSLTQPMTDVSLISDMHPATVTVKGFPAFLSASVVSLFSSSSASAFASVSASWKPILLLLFLFSTSSFNVQSVAPSMYKYAP